MSIKKAAEFFREGDEIRYPLAHKYGDYYHIGEKESIDGLYTPLLFQGEVIGSELHLCELVSLADDHAWTVFEAYDWYVSKGVTPPDHIKPCLPH